MSVLIRCVQCQKKLSIPETGLGKKIRCPACQTVFVAAAESAISAAPAPPAPAKSAHQDKTRAGPPPALAAREDADEDADERPAKRRKREREPFPPINFRAIVKNKNSIIKKGNWQATVDEEGMIIKRKKLGDVEIPIGARVEYEGKNKISVEIDDEVVEMQVARFRTYHNRFTEALVDFLTGDVRELWKEDFEIPWYMFILVILPLGAPAVTCLIGAIPFGLAAGMAGANFGVVSQEKWSPSTRIIVASILTGVTYVLMFVLAFFVYRAQMRLFQP